MRFWAEARYFNMAKGVYAALSEEDRTALSFTCACSNPLSCAGGFTGGFKLPLPADVCSVDPPLFGQSPDYD